LKILTPILPHTTDELWSYLNEEEPSVQLTDFPEVDERSNFKELKEKWSKVMDIRDEVLKALEEARNEKVIGKPLDAKVVVYTDDEEVLSLLNDEKVDFKQISLVSQFVVAGSRKDAPENAIALEKTSIAVEKADGEKCERCWSYSETVGQNEKHPTLCSRCAEIVINHYE
jgi:isoleucyl-tRNA synthetase